MFYSEVLFVLFFHKLLCIHCYGLFPGGSSMGMFAAIAIPINLPSRHVFVSVNFEANYNLPSGFPDIFPGVLSPFQNLAQDISRSLENNNSVSMEKEINYEKKRSLLPYPLISRKSIYGMLEKKLKGFGFQGRPCLLKAICEVNESSLGENNGVLGSILHIIFSPSNSEFEDIGEEFYIAELDGQYMECSKYSKNCPHDMINMISVLY